MTQPSDPVTGEHVSNPYQLEIDRLSAEVERLRGSATTIAPTVTVNRASACLHQHAGNSATMICVADGDHDGWHVYHRIENVSIIEQEGQCDGPR